MHLCYQSIATAKYACQNNRHSHVVECAKRCLRRLRRQEIVKILGDAEVCQNRAAIIIKQYLHIFPRLMTCLLLIPGFVPVKDQGLA